MPRLREFRYDEWLGRRALELYEDQPAIIAFDTETTGLGFHDEPFAATLTWRRPDGSLLSAYADLTDTRRVEQVRDMLRAVPAWVAHNAKFDLQKLILVSALQRYEIEQHELHDTQTIYHLLDENGRKGLKELAVRVLNYDDTIEVEVKSGPNKGTKKRVPKEQHHLNAVRRKLGLKKEDGYHLLPRPVLIPYALRDTEFTLRLYERLWPELQRKGEDVLAWYALEMQLLLDLLDMEADGLALDLAYLDRTTSEWGVRVMELHQRLCDVTGNPDFNPNSNPQLAAAFKARGLNVENTQAKTIEKIDDELVQTLLEYRGAFKVYGTYLRAMQRDQRGGVVHPSFNPTGARTGRLSSGSAKE